jgi:hypothetical protein
MAQYHIFFALIKSINYIQKTPIGHRVFASIIMVWDTEVKTNRNIL